MNKEDNEIKKMLKDAQNYFGKDETIYIFKCKKCKKLDPVPSFIVNEQMGFFKSIKKEYTSEMECPYCGGSMLPLNLKN